MIINYLRSTGTAFAILVLMTGITAAIPYGFFALAQIKWRRADRKAGQTARFVRDMIVAVLVLVFSIFSSGTPATPAEAPGSTELHSS